MYIHCSIFARHLSQGPVYVRLVRVFYHCCRVISEYLPGMSQALTLVTQECNAMAWKHSGLGVYSAIYQIKSGRKNQPQIPFTP